MRFSVVAHAFSTDLIAALAAARGAGFTGVVLEPAVFGALAETSQTGRREIVHHLARHDQTLVGVDVRLGVTGLSPRGDLEREVDRVSRAIDITRGLRGTLVLCDLGPLPPAPDEAPTPKPSIAPSLLGKLILPEAPKPVPTLPPTPRDAAFEASVEHALRELGIRADRAGCFVAFRSSLGSFASLAAALERVDCPWFGVDLDPLALLADEWSIDAIFSRLGPLLRHVRGRDGVKGSGNRVVSAELGKGQLDWRTLRAACHDADYDGFFTIDSVDLPDRAASALRGLARLSPAQ